MGVPAGSAVVVAVPLRRVVVVLAGVVVAGGAVDFEGVRAAASTTFFTPDWATASSTAGCRLLR